MFYKAVQALIAAIIVITVGAASYFGGYQAGINSAAAATAPAQSKPAASNPLSNPWSELLNPDYHVFLEAWNLIDKEYYNPQAIDHTKMAYGAIKGMLESLNDPYTLFATPSHAQMNDEDLRGAFDGIGVVVELKDKKLTVVAPQEDSPGEKAGLKPGDIIVMVDGKPTADLNLAEAVGMIRGPRGTVVRLTIIREGEPNPIEFDVTRAEIKVVNVKVKDLGEGMYYVKLNGFAEPTARELSEAVRGIVDKQPKGLVFDMRNNPGGLLTTSVSIASIFLKDGVVLYEDERNGQSLPFPVRKTATVAADVPLVVLINKGSASASEIVAGAIQDSGRGILVGEQSFGKDTVQNVHVLSDNSSVRITIARWATPKRQDIHQTGLKPDIEVKMTTDDLKAGRDPQLEAATNYLKSVGSNGSNGSN